MADAPDYLRVIGTSALNGVSTAAWVAAGELPPGKRRVVRTATTLTAVAVGWATLPPQERPFTWSPGSGFTMAKPAEEVVETPRPESGRSTVLALGMIALTTGVAVGGRMLEKRWLAGLQRSGHPRPYRALAWRMAVLNVAGSLPANLLDVQRAKDRAAGRRPERR